MNRKDRAEFNKDCQVLYLNMAKALHIKWSDKMTRAEVRLGLTYWMDRHNYLGMMSLIDKRKRRKIK